MSGFLPDLEVGNVELQMMRKNSMTTLFKPVVLDEAILCREEKMRRV